MKPNWPIVNPKDLQLTLKSLQDQLGIPLNRALYQIQQMLASGLTLRDNMNAAIVTIPCTHGTEVPFSKGTLTGLPIAFTPLSVSLTAGGTALQVSGTPAINYARTDGYLGLTVNFAPPVGDIKLINCSNASLATGADTLLQWGSAEAQNPTVANGNNLSFAIGSPTRITCAVAGKLQVDAQLSWAAGTSSGRRDCKIFRSGAQLASLILPGTGSVVYEHVCTYFNVVAGDYIELKALHDSATTPLTCANAEHYLQARYIGLSSISAYSANVTGILWGG